MTRLLASSVVRGTQLGESHGGLYLVDFDNRRITQRLDWNTTDIDISGRGGDRGLRGIAFHDGGIIVAANAEILFLDAQFRWIASATSRYLRHCHEIAVRGSQLLCTSTGFDSILTLDLRKRRFEAGVHLFSSDAGLALREFDPLSADGPAANQSLHLNSVTAGSDYVRFSGVRMAGLMQLSGAALTMLAPLPPGTHNAQILEEGLIYNDTAGDRLCFHKGATPVYMNVPQYPQAQIRNPGKLDAAVARPGFARGLCQVSPGIVAGGSSPSTVALYDLATGQLLDSINLSMDVRNAIHGLALWPYD
jgi:hypothetical protein